MMPVDNDLRGRLEEARGLFAGWNRALISIIDEVGGFDSESVRNPDLREGGVPFLRFMGILTRARYGEYVDGKLPQYDTDPGYLLVFAGQGGDRKRSLGIHYPTEPDSSVVLSQVDVSEADRFQATPIFEVGVMEGVNKINIPCGVAYVTEIRWDAGHDTGIKASWLWFPRKCIAPGRDDEIELVTAVAGKNSAKLNELIRKAYGNGTFSTVRDFEA